MEEDNTEKSNEKLENKEEKNEQNTKKVKKEKEDVPDITKDKKTKRFLIALDIALLLVIIGLVVYIIIKVHSA